jgi:hypothetical protein
MFALCKLKSGEMTRSPSITIVQATWEKPFSLAAKWKKRFLATGGKPVRKDTNCLLVPLIKYCSNVHDWRNEADHALSGSCSN